MWNVNNGGRRILERREPDWIKTQNRVLFVRARPNLLCELSIFLVRRDTFRSFLTADGDDEEDSRRRGRLYFLSTDVASRPRVLGGSSCVIQSNSIPQRRRHFLRRASSSFRSNDRRGDPGVPFDGIFKSNRIPLPLSPSPLSSAYSITVLRQLATSKVLARRSPRLARTRKQRDNIRR